MPEMIERVARALWDAQATRPDTWDSLHPSKQAGMRDRARAAIEAMQEPTDAMVDRGAEVDGPSGAIEVWGEMISAALEEP